MPTLLTMKNQNLCKYNKKMANAQDLFDLLPTLIPPTSAKILEYVSAYAILGVLRSSNSISYIFIDEKSC